MALKMKIVGMEKFAALAKNSAAMRQGFKIGMVQKVTLLGEAIRSRSVSQYLSGRPGLNVVTGRLSSSIAYDVREDGENSSLRVGTNVVYGKVHELGMTIRPKNKKFLSWVGAGGKRVFAREVTIPPRPWLRPSIEEELPIFKTRVEEFLRQVAMKGLSSDG
jgi:phage gpG-like protein